MRKQTALSTDPISRRGILPWHRETISRHGARVECDQREITQPSMPAFSKGSPRLIRGPMHLHNSLSVYRLPIHSRDPVPSSLSLTRKLVSWRRLFSLFFSFFLSFPFISHPIIFPFSFCFSNWIYLLSSFFLFRFFRFFESLWKTVRQRNSKFPLPVWILFRNARCIFRDSTRN